MRRFERDNVQRAWLWHEDRPPEREEVEEPEVLVNWPAWLIELLRLEGLI